MYIMRLNLILWPLFCYLFLIFICLILAPLVIYILLYLEVLWKKRSIHYRYITNILGVKKKNFCYFSSLITSYYIHNQILVIHSREVYNLMVMIGNGNDYQTIFWKECMITVQWKRVMLHNQIHKIVHSSAMYYQNLIIIHECSKKLLKMKNS